MFESAESGVLVDQQNCFGISKLLTHIKFYLQVLFLYNILLQKLLNVSNFCIIVIYIYIFFIYRVFYFCSMLVNKYTTLVNVL